jgi:hypothetical protein
MTERFRATIGVPGLPVREGFSGHIESLGFLPAPTSAETLRHIADTISGDGAFIMQGILRRAAGELDGQFEALKLAVGMLLLHGHDGDAKKVVAESKRWKGEADAQPKAG